MAASGLKDTQLNDEPDTKAKVQGESVQGFLVGFLRDLARDAVKFIIAFAVGTGAGAIVCWYYGVPLVFSLLGGILVLGLALALSTDSLFS